MLFSSFVVCGKRERKAARNTASFRRLVTPLSLSLSLSHAPFLFCFANIDCYMCPFYSSFSVFYMFNIVLGNVDDVYCVHRHQSVLLLFLVLLVLLRRHVRRLRRILRSARRVNRRRR